MTRGQMFMKMAVSSLLRRRSRMLVALLAVGIGATILSGLIAIYRDVPVQMSKAFRSYGANLIVTPAAGGPPLTSARLEALRTVIPGDRLVGTAAFAYANVRLNEQPYLAAGTDFAAVRLTSPYWYVEGAWPATGEQLLLGREVAERIGLMGGDHVTLSGSRRDGEKFERRFEVAGIVQTGSNEEHYIYLEAAALAQLTGAADEFDVMECSIAMSQDELTELAAALGAGDGQLEVRPVARVAQSEGRVLSKLQSLVYIVTLVVLALTMVCVATTMMAVVAERRPEIGLRKALGASNRSIMSEFMTESLILGALGGVLGGFCGHLFAYYVSSHVFGRPVDPDVLLMLLTVLISILVTGMASYAPIVNASQVDPVIVLRGE